MIFAQQPSNRVSFLARCRRLQREVPIASDLWWLRRTARRRTLLRLAEVCSVSVSFAVLSVFLKFFKIFHLTGVCCLWPKAPPTLCRTSRGSGQASTWAAAHRSDEGGKIGTECGRSVSVEFSRDGIVIDCEFLRFNCDLLHLFLWFVVAYCGFVWQLVATCSFLACRNMLQWSKRRRHIVSHGFIRALRISVFKLQHPKPWLVKTEIFIEFHRFIIIY